MSQAQSSSVPERSADDSDLGWGEGTADSPEEQLRRRLAEYEHQRPPHAGE